MKFENDFVVQAPVDDVYAALLDVERVAPCMPGAEVLEKTGDDTYKVAIKVKVGPMSMTYRGDVEIVDRDDAAKTATLRAKARESRGQGTADAKVHMSLAEEGAGTHATLDTDVALGGRVAAMGRGVIADVSGRLVQTFAGNLAEMLESNGAAPAQEAEPAAAAPQAESSLPVGDIVGGVVADRMSDRKALVAGAGIFAMICLVIGYRVGRSR